MRSHQPFLLFAAVVLLGCCAATTFAGEQTLHVGIAVAKRCWMPRLSMHSGKQR
jgi:hypothetical protein